MTHSAKEILVVLYQLVIATAIGASFGIMGLFMLAQILLDMEIGPWPASVIPEKPFAIGVPAVLVLAALVSLLRAALVPASYRRLWATEADGPCRPAVAIATLAGDIMVLSILLFATGFAAGIGRSIFSGLMELFPIGWPTARVLLYGLPALIGALGLWAVRRLILNPVKFDDP